MLKMRSIMIQAAGLLVALTTSVAAQSDYPNRPVRLIIPFPPGGSNDVVGRMIGTQLSEQLGKQVIVDNRAGAGGVVGTEIVTKAAPDGSRTRSIRGSTNCPTIRSRRSRRSASWVPARTCWWSILAFR
jgi:tripartite-type tricarboxylate transporter receptor subunit TctC